MVARGWPVVCRVVRAAMVGADGGAGMASGVSCGARRDGGRRLNGARCVVPKVCRLLYRTMSIMKGDRPWR